MRRASRAVANRPGNPPLAGEGRTAALLPPCEKPGDLRHPGFDLFERAIVPLHHSYNCAIACLCDTALRFWYNPRSERMTT